MPKVPCFAAPHPDAASLLRQWDPLLVGSLRII